MVPGREQIVLQSSTALKEALGAYAQEHDLFMADVIRKAVADFIGYDLANEPKMPRNTIAMTEQEKKDRAATKRWALATGQRLLADGQIEAATVIARAVADKDYEALDDLKTAYDAMKAEREAEEE